MKPLKLIKQDTDEFPQLKPTSLQFRAFKEWVSQVRISM
jgi:hypothetical protein